MAAALRSGGGIVGPDRRRGLQQSGQDPTGAYLDSRAVVRLFRDFEARAKNCEYLSMLRSHACVGWLVAIHVADQGRMRTAEWVCSVVHKNAVL